MSAFEDDDEDDFLPPGFLAPASIEEEQFSFLDALQADLQADVEAGRNYLKKIVPKSEASDDLVASSSLLRSVLQDKKISTNRTNSSGDLSQTYQRQHAEEVNRLKGEKEKLVHDLQKLEMELALEKHEKQTSVESLEREIENLGAHLDQEKQYSEEISKRLESALLEAAQLRQEKEEADNEALKYKVLLDDKRSDLGATIRSLQRRMGAFRAERDEFRNLYDDERAKFKDVHRELIDCKSQRDEFQETSEERICQLEHTINEQRATIDQLLTKDTSGAIDEANNLAKEVESLKAELEFLQATLDEEIQGNVSVLRDLRLQLADAHSRYEATAIELAKIEICLRESSAREALLKQTLTQNQAAMLTMRNRFHAVQEENAKVAREAMECVNSMIKEKLSSQTATIQSKQARLDSLNAEVDHLRYELNEARDDLNHVLEIQEETEEAFESTMNDATNFIQVLRKEHEEKLARYKEQYDLMEQDLMEVLEREDEMKEKYDDQQRETSEKIREVQLAMDELETMKACVMDSPYSLMDLVDLFRRCKEYFAGRRTPGTAICTKSASKSYCTDLHLKKDMAMCDSSSDTMSTSSELIAYAPLAERPLHGSFQPIEVSVPKMMSLRDAPVAAAKKALCEANDISAPFSHPDCLEQNQASAFEVVPKVMSPTKDVDETVVSMENSTRTDDDRGFASASEVAPKEMSPTRDVDKTVVSMEISTRTDDDRDFASASKVAPKEMSLTRDVDETVVSMEISTRTDDDSGSVLAPKATSKLGSGSTSHTKRVGIIPEMRPSFKPPSRLNKLTKSVRRNTALPPRSTIPGVVSGFDSNLERVRSSNLSKLSLSGLVAPTTDRTKLRSRLAMYGDRQSVVVTKIHESCLREAPETRNISIHTPQKDDLSRKFERLNKMSKLRSSSTTSKNRTSSTSNAPTGINNSVPVRRVGSGISPPRASRIPQATPLKVRGQIVELFSPESPLVTPAK